MSKEPLSGRHRRLRKYVGVMGQSLNPSTLLLHRVLGDLADENDCLLVPDYQDLAEVMSVDRHTVSKALDELAGTGLIRCEGPIQSGSRVQLLTPDPFPVEAASDGLPRRASRFPGASGLWFSSYAPRA